MKLGAIWAIAAFATASTPSFPRPPTVQPDPLAPLRQAKAYSLAHHDGIAIFINSAPVAHGREPEIGGALIGRVSRQGLQAAYFFFPGRGGETSITYFVKGVPYGPYRVSDALQGLDTACKDLIEDNAYNR